MPESWPDQERAKVVHVGVRGAGAQQIAQLAEKAVAVVRLFGLRKRSATGEHEFDKLCAELGIEHRLTPPKSPQTNGMVERFNGRIEDILQSHRFHSGEDLEQTLLRYAHLYNNQLPQSVLKGRSPINALKDWQRQRPELFRKRVYNHAGCDT